MGVVELELYWKHAPKTCKNFAELAKVGYYNNVIFHRIIPDFMIQGGDPTGTGKMLKLIKQMIPFSNNHYLYIKTRK